MATTGIPCPSCNLTDSFVVDSRRVPKQTRIRRRRECSYCGTRFTTYEVWAADYEQIEKAATLILSKVKKGVEIDDQN